MIKVNSADGMEQSFLHKVKSIFFIYNPVCHIACSEFLLCMENFALMWFRLSKPKDGFSNSHNVCG